ncbi:hypothetical protein D3C72_2453510 [compost metagenome]
MPEHRIAPWRQALVGEACGQVVGAADPHAGDVLEAPLLVRAVAEAESLLALLSRHPADVGPG